MTDIHDLVKSHVDKKALFPLVKKYIPIALLKKHLLLQSSFFARGGSTLLECLMLHNIHRDYAQMLAVAHLKQDFD